MYFPPITFIAGVWGGLVIAFLGLFAKGIGAGIGPDSRAFRLGRFLHSAGAGLVIATGLLALAVSR